MKAPRTPVDLLESLLQARSAMAGATSRLALMIPTTPCVQGSETYRNADMVIGSDTTALRMVSPVAALEELETRGHPRLVLVHSDQLVMPGTANVLLRLDDFHGYISGIEYLLASKHGYRLGAWTIAGLRYLERDASIDQVARLVVAHLQSCSGLGERWRSSGLQIYRSPAHRQLHKARMARYVQSSIAAAFVGARDEAIASLMSQAVHVQSLADKDDWL